MTIRTRLTLWYTSLLAAILIVLGVALYLFVSVQLMNDTQKRLETQANDVKRNIKVVDFFGQTYFQLPSLQGFKSANMFIQSYNFVTETVDSNQSIQLEITESAIRDALANRSTTQIVRVQDVKVLVYSTPLSVDNKVRGLLQVFTIIDDIAYTLDRLKNMLLLIGAVALLLSATLGWMMSGKVLKPIEGVIDAARSIESGADLSRTIQYLGPADEIGRLISTINGMFARLHDAYFQLEEAYRNQRRFVSDASHELRTPLTTIRGNVEWLKRVWEQAKTEIDTTERSTERNADEIQASLEALNDIADEAERMSRLVNDMLELARADAGVEIDKRHLAIRPLVEEVSRRAQFLSRTAEWKPGDFSALEGVTVFGNKDYLQQLLFILIENAFKYTEQGVVTMDGLRQDDQVGIRIADTGVGMDKEEVPQIFERFYRADVSRGKTQGTGLGLAIARWILEQHNGSVEVMTSRDAGTTFVIWLPCAFPPGGESSIMEGV